jgi:hypothetical protein
MSNNDILTALKCARVALLNGTRTDEPLRVVDAALASMEENAARPIMLEIAAASREQETWERRFQYLCRVFEPDKRFVDTDGKWGLRDFLAYAGEVCGFAAQGIEAGTAETVQQGSVHESPVERSSMRPNSLAQPPQDNIS